MSERGQWLSSPFIRVVICQRPLDVTSVLRFWLSRLRRTLARDVKGVQGIHPCSEEPPLRVVLHDSLSPTAEVPLLLLCRLKRCAQLRNFVGIVSCRSVQASYLLVAGIVSG